MIGQLGIVVGEKLAEDQQVFLETAFVIFAKELAQELVDQRFHAAVGGGLVVEVEHQKGGHQRVHTYTRRKTQQTDRQMKKRGSQNGRHTTRNDHIRTVHREDSKSRAVGSES
jgi:hypothetical protein